ncbi:MAG: hypothetical protein KDA21_06560, partial [Phycisphaerales bacterium]|nr:hypothetical protein [Phycisphaerales bacterium]
MAARRGRVLGAATLAALLVFGVSSVQASGGCYGKGRPYRSHRSHSHWVHRAPPRPAPPPVVCPPVRWTAGTLSVDGRCFTISDRNPSHEVVRVLR